MFTSINSLRHGSQRRSIEMSGSQRENQRQWNKSDQLLRTSLGGRTWNFVTSLILQDETQKDLNQSWQHLNMLILSLLEQEDLIPHMEAEDRQLDEEAAVLNWLRLTWTHNLSILQVSVLKLLKLSHGSIIKTCNSRNPRREWKLEISMRWRNVLSSQTFRRRRSQGSHLRMLTWLNKTFELTITLLKPPNQLSQIVSKTLAKLDKIIMILTLHLAPWWEPLNFKLNDKKHQQAMSHLFSKKKRKIN